MSRWSESRWRFNIKLLEESFKDSSRHSPFNALSCLFIFSFGIIFEFILFGISFLVVRGRADVNNLTRSWRDGGGNGLCYYTVYEIIYNSSTHYLEGSSKSTRSFI